MEGHRGLRPHLPAVHHPRPWSRRSTSSLTSTPACRDDDLVVHNFVDIGIAVDLDYQGLLVPVVRAAETKRLRAIAREINDLAGRAAAASSAPTRSAAARSRSPTTARPAAC